MMHTFRVITPPIIITIGRIVKLCKTPRSLFSSMVSCRRSYRNCNIVKNYCPMIFRRPNSCKIQCSPLEVLIPRMCPRISITEVIKIFKDQKSPWWTATFPRISRWSNRFLNRFEFTRSRCRRKWRFWSQLRVKSSLGSSSSNSSNKGSRFNISMVSSTNGAPVKDPKAEAEVGVQAKRRLCEENRSKRCPTLARMYHLIPKLSHIRWSILH